MAESWLQIARLVHIVWIQTTSKLSVFVF